MSGHRSMIWRIKVVKTYCNNQIFIQKAYYSLKDLSALLKKHFKGYKEDTAAFQKIGSYLRRPEYKFQSRHTNNGTLYLIKRRV